VALATRPTLPTVDARRKRLVLLALCSAALIINIDVTIVNVTLPSLVRELHASTTNLQWVVDAYTLVFAALILAAGSLGIAFAVSDRGCGRRTHGGASPGWPLGRQTLAQMLAEILRDVDHGKAEQAERLPPAVLPEGEQERGGQHQPGGR